MKSGNYIMTAKTMAGLENILAEELKSLGANDIVILQRAVSFTGDKELMYKANLWCRTALRILKPLLSFEVKDEDELYKKVYDIKWEDYLDVDSTLTVDTVINNTNFTNSLYISQKTKDAIVDRFYELEDKRPSVDIKDPDLRINVHISGTPQTTVLGGGLVPALPDSNLSGRFRPVRLESTVDSELSTVDSEPSTVDKQICTISLDSSGISLHKRGYRQQTVLAPINEVLAAGLILLSGWKRDCNFIDPMCGSGTFLVEAALYANNIPPAYYRKSFGFQKWKDYDSKLWNDIVNQSLLDQIEFEYDIIGSDISLDAIEIAEENIRFAKLHKDISLEKIAFEDFTPPEGKGILIMNPPYGERMKEDKLIELYQSIGDTLKRKYAGYEAWVISSDMQAMKFIGLKPSRKLHLFNGPLECRYEKFEVYEGSKKGSKINSNPHS